MGWDMITGGGGGGVSSVPDSNPRGVKGIRVALFFPGKFVWEWL